MSERLGRLRELMTREGLEAILISQPENRRYLSGFTGSAGVLLISEDRAMLATDFRYYDQVEMQSPGWELVKVTDRMAKALAALVDRLGLTRLGYESHVLTVRIHQLWRDAMPDVEWVPTNGLVEGLRQIKDAGEIVAIEEAVRIADQGMGHVMEWLRPGVTEREVAWELEVYMRTRGAERLSFETVVASGPNGAMPHAVTSDRVIQEGDPVVIDMGAVYEGYCSDLTRSFCLGRASGEYREVWATVLEAQREAQAAMTAGMLGAQADGVARRIIDAAGYQGRFGHGLGHGVGLAIHEKPRAGRTSDDILEAGSVVTVEPGIYIPGWGGVRIEDMVVITEEGCRVLTKSAKLPVMPGGA